MTTTSRQEPSTERLIDRAHAHGIRVWWRDRPTGDAHWSARHRAIWLSPTLTDREARSLLAHELGHAYYDDTGPQPEQAERRAWRYAALTLISRDAYVAAELTYGQDTAAIAEALDVTVEVVEAYQRILETT